VILQRNAVQLGHQRSECRGLSRVRVDARCFRSVDQRSTVDDGRAVGHERCCRARFALSSGPGHDPIGGSRAAGSHGHGKREERAPAQPAGTGWAGKDQGQPSCGAGEHCRPDDAVGRGQRLAVGLDERLSNHAGQGNDQRQGGQGKPASGRMGGSGWVGRRVGHRPPEDTLTIRPVARRYTRVITTPAAARSARAGRPFVSLLTDWGLRDPSPAICRGVILNIAPDALIVDISHEVAKFNIRHGALLLWSALPFLPVGAHVAVVDPGVGTHRRGIALETARGDYLVGPDNGLLLPGAQRLGGVTRVHMIENPQYLLPAISATFHGRDVFAPAAAHLALGVPLEHIGREVEPSSLVDLDWPEAVAAEGQLETTVVYVDTFGNVKLSALASDLHAAFPDLALGDRLPLRVGGGERRRRTAAWVRTFGDAPTGELLVCEDSYGRLSLVCNQASAAELLRVGDGELVTFGGGRMLAGGPQGAAAQAGEDGDQAAE